MKIPGEGPASDGSEQDSNSGDSPDNEKPLSFNKHLEGLGIGADERAEESKTYNIKEEVAGFLKKHPGYEMTKAGERSAFCKKDENNENKTAIISYYLDKSDEYLMEGRVLAEIEQDRDAQSKLLTSMRGLAIGLAGIDAAADGDDKQKKAKNTEKDYAYLQKIIEDPQTPPEKKEYIEGYIGAMDGKELIFLKSYHELHKDDEEDEEEEKQKFVQELEKAQDDLKSELLGLGDSSLGCERILTEIEEVKSGGTVDTDELRTLLSKLKVKVEEFATHINRTKSKHDSYENMLFSNMDSPLDDEGEKHYLSEDEARPFVGYAFDAEEQIEEYTKQFSGYEDKMAAIQKYINRLEDIGNGFDW